ncbi:MAG TPA: deoxyribose-phosphate aldolase [Gemmatimonadaceae bacterium]|nr:deoxyribose-phosphate aldolase [Gemmatimonadaceae bacterium]
MSAAERIADLIDHTLLKADATRSDIERLCAEARHFGFVAVCVNPVWVPLCREVLHASAVRVVTVVGFPLGANQTATKVGEASLAVAEGADELDMVAALGHLKGGDWRYVASDIRAVVRAAGGRLVKVIIESALLTPEEITRASRVARDAGAGYVKTSTGMHALGGATVAAVSRMRAAVGSSAGVKASGGIRDCATAIRMLAAGASRLGTSSGVRIAECLGDTPLSRLVEDAAAHAGRCTTSNRSVTPATAPLF